MLKKIDQKMFSELTAEAQNSERLRKNLNFHDSYGDPSQSMLVAIEPNAYIRRNLWLPPFPLNHCT